MDRTTRITIASGGMTQEVELESYVAGVVTHELTGPISAELAKAQAVAARTYAMYAMQYPRHANAAVCDTTHCQRYAPAVQEYPQVLDAIAESTGGVLMFNGALANTVYSAYCAGTTRSAAEAGWGSVPYLVSVPCECREWRGEPNRHGHGVGMCQRGAQKLALDGWNYKDILAHYYAGTRLEKRGMTPLEEAQPYKAIAYWGGSGIAKAARAYGLVPLSNEFAGEGAEVRQLWADDAGNEYVFNWRPGWADGRLLYPSAVSIEPVTPAEPRRDWTLAVSHLSQSDIYPDSDFAPGDCGPVSFAMWAQRQGKYFSPDSFSEAVTRATGRPSGFSTTTRDDLVALGRWFALPTERIDNVTLGDVRRQIVEYEKPLIALVHAGDLRMRSYAFDGGHYVLIVGVIGDSIQYHDPYERRDGRGSYVRVEWGEFAVAWQNATIDGNQAFTGVRFL